MTTESIIVLILAIVIVAVVWQLRKKKGESAPLSTQATPPSAAPASKYLTAADYADSFFSGRLAGVPIKPYELPAHIKGYGAGGRYDRNKYDPTFYVPGLDGAIT